MTGEVHVNHRELLRFATATFLFSTTGMSAADAATVADLLVWANARGTDSHGVIRIPIYLREIKSGVYKPDAQPVLRQLLPATFMLECNRAPGPVCMMRAAAHAIDTAEKFGVGVGLLSDPHHLGAIGRYAQWVAERGHAALVILAGLPFMAYHGAKVASIGTSPIAIGIPGPGLDAAPLLFDMSTSVKAAGLIHQALTEGKPLPNRDRRGDRPCRQRRHCQRAATDFAPVASTARADYGNGSEVTGRWSRDSGRDDC